MNQCDTSAPIGVDEDLGGNAVEVPLHSLPVRLIVKHVRVQIAVLVGIAIDDRSSSDDRPRLVSIRDVGNSALERFAMRGGQLI